MKGDFGLRFRRIAQRVRVPVGFLLLPLLFLLARPTPVSLTAGVILSVVGLLIRGWASGHLQKNRRLAVTGPYSFTRNPLYLGTFLLAAGAAVATASITFCLIFIGLYLLIYVPVMQAESETIGELFPDEYPGYRASVPLFLPGLRRYQAVVAESRERFSFARYMRHREYRATIGTVVVYAGLVALYMLKG